MSVTYEVTMMLDPPESTGEAVREACVRPPAVGLVVAEFPPDAAEITEASEVAGLVVAEFPPDAAEITEASEVAELIVAEFPPDAAEITEASEVVGAGLSVDAAEVAVQEDDGSLSPPMRPGHLSIPLSPASQLSMICCSVGWSQPEICRFVSRARAELI